MSEIPTGAVGIVADFKMRAPEESGALFFYRIK